MVCISEKECCGFEYPFSSCKVGKQLWATAMAQCPDPHGTSILGAADWEMKTHSTLWPCLIYPLNAFSVFQNNKISKHNQKIIFCF